MVNKKHSKKSANVLGILGVLVICTLLVVGLIAILFYGWAKSDEFYLQPTYEITEMNFNESSSTPTFAEQKVIDSFNIALSSNVSNGYIDIISNDGITFPRFCWYDGKNYYSTPIVASSASNIRIQEYLYYSEQPHKYDNGYFNRTNVTIDSEYDGEELTLTLIHTPVIY